jgi:hypothetical protein
MSTLTSRQREVLQHRIERAICWAQSSGTNKDQARYIARIVMDEINSAGLDGKASERAVTAIASRLEQSA